MDRLRQCFFRPYRKGQGPTFRLTTWSAGYNYRHGKEAIRYELKQGRIILFAGADFYCSPLNAIDSDRAISALMGFLTLRPGDTDPDYFKDYTDAQRDFCDQHAERLALEVSCRFGDD
jgi:hypothetical protein